MSVAPLVTIDIVVGPARLITVTLPEKVGLTIGDLLANDAVSPAILRWSMLA